jgi:NAD(P)H-flavin reductase
VRVQAPFGRRRVAVTGADDVGAYRVLHAADLDGPVPWPGQFYMLAAVQRWGAGDDERPFVPRAFSFLGAADGQLSFMFEDVGPGTHRLGELRAGDELWITGPLGEGFELPGEERRVILAGGGVGLPPLAAWATVLRAHGLEPSVLLGFRDAAHAAGAKVFGATRRGEPAPRAGAEAGGETGSGAGAAPAREAAAGGGAAVAHEGAAGGGAAVAHEGAAGGGAAAAGEAAAGAGAAPAREAATGGGPVSAGEFAAGGGLAIATDDGSVGHEGFVTELLAAELVPGSDANAVVYACGPPGMLEAVRALCGARGVPAQLALEAGMACGFGACFGCVVPVRDGGYVRVCVDGPVLDAARLDAVPAR